LPRRPERLLTSNGKIVTGRFAEHVGQTLSEAFVTAGLPVFAGAEAGKNYPPGCSRDEKPDLILLNTATESTCLVVDIKVPWNANLNNTLNRSMTSTSLGMSVRSNQY
jgi:hypothetical protein